jgi:hypothetical protein
MGKGQGRGLGQGLCNGTGNERRELSISRYETPIETAGDSRKESPAVF